MVTRKQLEKKALKVVHSNPTAFVAMIRANKSMSESSKIRALKNYIRKHGRRSTTIE